MNATAFSARIMTVILTIVAFHIMGIELMVVFVMSPSLSEFTDMLLYPLPLAIALVGVFILLTHQYAGPVRLFLKRAGSRTPPDRSLTLAALGRCNNLSYFMSAISFPAYIIGGVGGIWLVSRVYTHWPPHIMIYGVLAGIIAGLMTIPMSEHATAWAIRPTLRVINEHGAEFIKSGLPGLRIPLRLKFVIIAMVMVAGVGGYTVIISYTMINQAINNMQDMERLLPEESAATLAAAASGSTDNSLKSAAYFKSRMGNLLLFFLGLSLTGTVLSLVVGLTAADTITRPLRQFSRVVENINSGRYDETIHVITNDEFSELGASFNRMTASLLQELKENQALISSIDEAVQVLEPMSGELLSIAGQQAEKSARQFSDAENAENTGREIAETARQIAENAAQATINSKETQTITLAGQQRLGETETTFETIADNMRQIGESVSRLMLQSREITDIVETIKKISGQTNILALHADIEAHKAGNGGEQFGQVAQDVRRLAGDTNQSAKKIRSYIQQIQESVEAAALFAKEGGPAVSAGQAVITQMIKRFRAIIRANTHTVQELSQIATETLQQAESNQRLSEILSGIRQTAQETSDSTEQARHALMRLKDLIDQLQPYAASNDKSTDTVSAAPIV